MEIVTLIIGVIAHVVAALANGRLGTVGGRTGVESLPCLTTTLICGPGGGWRATASLNRCL